MKTRAGRNGSTVKEREARAWHAGGCSGFRVRDLCGLVGLIGLELAQLWNALVCGLLNSYNLGFGRTGCTVQHGMIVGFGNLM